ncbi:MAG: DUF2283 domain-containing protein [Methanobacteriaceae archaeon]|nr:DUF2283 domain-containing protein [Methanobacteriaceae archaeon]
MMVDKRILNWDYDPKRDIIFIFSFPNYDYQESFKMGNMMVDLDSNGKPVALEITSSSESLGVVRGSLIGHLNFSIEISAKRRSLKVNASFKFSSEKGVIERTLLKEAKMENKTILKNYLKPVYSQ